MTNRPYKVGMDRPQGRYIEPDAIYTDMAPGRPTRIPREFPYTWNPVNGFATRGLGATPSGASSQGFVEDVFDAIVDVGKETGKKVVDDTKSNLTDGGSKAVEDFLNNTPAGKLLLDKVKQKAADGVTGVVKEQAPNLIVLAVAGGAVGGALSAKLGKVGTIGAIGLALYCAFQIYNAKPPA